MKLESIINLISEALTEEQYEDSIKDIRDIRETSILTRDRGLVITDKDGESFIIRVQKY